MFELRNLGGQTFTRLSVMGLEDALLLGLAALGTAWLVWLSWAALHGRIRSALLADWSDMARAEV